MTTPLHIDPDPVVEAYKQDLDLTLIEENLKLMALQEFSEELRRAAKKYRDEQKP